MNLLFPQPLQMGSYVPNLWQDNHETCKYSTYMYLYNKKKKKGSGMKSLQIISSIADSYEIYKLNASLFISQ